MGNNEKFDVPPLTNRGAQNTNRGVPDEALVPCVDWLQATLKFPFNSPWEIIDILGLPREVLKPSTGAFGWSESLRIGGISVFYGGQEYYHVQLTGQGCRLFETLSDRGWEEVVADLITSAGSFSRFDLAIDDFKGYFTIKNLITLAKRGCVRSKHKKARSVEEFDLGDGSEYGKSLYLGKGSSRIQIRFYDKREERIAKGWDIQDLLPIWNRTEVQMRDERAQQAATMLAKGVPVGDLAAGILKEYCTFCVRSKTESNKARWKVQDFWLKFLGDVEPLRLSETHPESTVFRKYSWLKRQAKKALAMIFFGSDDGEKVLQELICEGLEELTETDFDLMEATREEYLHNLKIDQKFALDELREKRLRWVRNRTYEDVFVLKEKPPLALGSNEGHSQN